MILSNSTGYDVDVVIVGAGPVGLSIANLLGIKGVRVVVLEQLPHLIDYPRGVGIDDESLRGIQTMGLIDTVLPHTTPSHIMRLVGAKGQVIAEIAPSTDEFGWSRRNGFIQPEVDKALFRGIERFKDIQVLFGATAINISQTDSGVSIVYQDDSGATKTIVARYLVGADGGRSMVRKSTGVTFDGQSASTRWLVIDAHNDPLGTPNVTVGGDPRRPYVSLGLPHGIRRFEFMLFDKEPDELADDKEFLARLLKNHLPNPYDLEIFRKRVYTHHSRIAGSFQTGKIFLAGDAAHLMPVWQGQGWNSGMRDAVNLSWKLGQVINGQSDPKLLDTYHHERFDHAKAMIDISTTFGRFVKPTNIFVAKLRDVTASVLGAFPGVKNYFVQMRYKPMPRYTTGAVVDINTKSPGYSTVKINPSVLSHRISSVKASPVGTQFIQPQVIDKEGNIRLLDDIIGYRWAVLLWGGNPDQFFTSEQLEFMKQQDFTLISLRPVVQLHSDAILGTQHKSLVVGDASGAIKKWFDPRSTTLLFLRPDRFIAAAGLAQEAAELLEAVKVAASFRTSSREEITSR